MPATDTSGVKIVINVVDSNSGEVISRSVKNVDALGNAGSTAGKKLASGMAEAGTAGQRAGKQVGDGFKEMGGHAMTSLDNVRLLRDDLGIRIPRGMEMAISRSKVLSAAIGGIGGALVGLGSVELGFHVGKEAYDLYDKLTDINKEVRKYEEGAAKASAQNLFAGSDIETQLANLRQINSEVVKYQRQQTNATNRGFAEQFRQQFAAGSTPMDYTGVGYLVRAGKTAYDVHQGNTDRDAGLAERLQNRDSGADRAFATQQAAAMERLKNSIAARSAALTGMAADASEVQGKKEIAALTMRQTQQLNQRGVTTYDAHVAEITRTMREQKKSPSEIKAETDKLGTRPTADANAGMTRYQDETLAADEMGSAKRIATARRENEEVAHARDEAHQAGLQGEARYRAQLEATLAGYQRKVATSEMSAATAHGLSIAAQEKFDSEYAERRKAQFQETERMEAEARASGMTGFARSDADLQGRTRRIDQGIANTTIDPELGARQKAAATAGTRADQAKQAEDFADRIRQMDESRANSSMSANQRIDAETRHTTAEITKAWTDLYGGLGALDARRLQSQVALNAEIGRIQAAAAQQKAENTRTLEEQTLKAEAEAGRLGAPHAQEQTRAVIDDYNERIRELERLRAKDADNADLYRRQEVAAEQIKNGKLLDLERQKRDRLAGELRGFFSNPMEALKRQGEDLASKAAADLLQGRRPGSLPGDKNGGLLDGAGAIFRPTFKRNGQQPGAPVGNDHHAVIAPTSGARQAVVNATSATINVGSASFSGAGNGAGAPSSTVSSIANSGYVSTGNGGAFNLGSSPSSSEAGSAASIGNGGSDAGSGSPMDTVTNFASTAKGGFDSMKSLGQDLGIFGKGGSSGGGSNPFGSLTAPDMGSDSTGLGALTGSSDPFGAAGTSSPFGGAPAEAGSGASAMGAAGGAISGGLGVYAAFEGKGGVMGGLQGALAGAQLGASLGGPIGAAIGAVGGAVLGFIGHGARVQAQKYYFKELLPKMQGEMLGFEAGTAPYQTVYDDLSSSDTEAKAKTKQMGPGAVDYYGERIHPEILKFQQRLTREQKAGRSQFGMSAAQAHNGALLSNFGSMATSATEGWVHAERGEVLLNQQAAMSHLDVAMMMNAGRSRAEIADYMGGSGGGQRVADGDSGDVHLHVHTMDVKGVRDFLSTYKHDVRSAVNSSYAENSGGGD